MFRFALILGLLSMVGPFAIDVGILAEKPGIVEFHIASCLALDKKGCRRWSRTSGLSCEYDHGTDSARGNFLVSTALRHAFFRKPGQELRFFWPDIGKNQ